MYGTHYVGANASFALDSAQDHKLTFDVAEDLSADRMLNIIVGNADRTLDFTPTANFGFMYDSAAAKWKAKDIVATLPAIFKTDGSRAATGQITSTFAGAPISVADTTMCPNLNADRLDGLHGASYSLTSHAHTFVSLTDVPASYASQALKVLRVNAGETGLEFAAASAAAFTDMTDTPANYSGAGSKVLMVNAGATAVEFLGPWLDQDVRVAASPTFAGLTVNGNVTLTNCSTFSITDSPGNCAITLDGTLSVGSTCNVVGLFTANNQIVSTLADGTKPFAPTSTTLCDNLNADLLDGNHASAFALAAHTHPSTDITDFAEAVDDRLFALFVEGDGIDLTYDDGSDTLTIAADINTSNLKITAGEINTIQNISTSSEPVFASIALITSSDPGAKADGMIWYNTTQNMMRFETKQGTNHAMGTVAALTGSDQIINTSSETAFFTSHTIPASSCEQGKRFKLIVAGILSTDATMDYTWKIKVDSTVFLSSGPKSQTSVTNGAWRFEAEFTVKDVSVGSVNCLCNGWVTYPRDNDATPLSNTAAVAFTDGSSHTLEITVQMSSASAAKHITAQQLVIMEM